MFEVYCCLKCKGDLERQPELFRCLQCKEEYPILEEIPVFLKEKPRFLSGDSSFNKVLSELVELSKKKGYAQALIEVQIRRLGLLDYLTDLSRVDFKYLLPITKDSQILDIGAGHGLISLNLAKTVKSVYALEKVSANCQFMHIRAKEDGVDNLSVAQGGGGCLLPYKDNMFDIVILNGVFEWLGFEASFPDVKNIQRKLLDEVYRVLKDKGVFYITTRNKYSFELNISKNYHNNGMPGLLLFPDKLINSVSKLKGKEYLSGLLGVSQYIDFFKEANFSVDKVRVPLPDSRYPEEIFDYYRSRCKSRKRSQSFHASRLYRCSLTFLPFSIKKNLCISHMFILRKKRFNQTPLLSIVESLIDREPFLKGAYFTSLVAGTGSSLTSSVTVNLRKQNSEFICKFARFESLPFLNREVENLEKLKSLQLSRLKLLPEIIAHGNIGGFPYSVLPFYKSLKIYNRNFVQKLIMFTFLGRRFLPEVFDFLLELGLKSRKDNNLSFFDYAEKPIADFLEEKSDNALSQSAGTHLETLRKTWIGIPLVYAHNDLNLHNFVIQSIWPIRFKIIDWKSMEEDGLPGTDLAKICKLTYAGSKLTDSLLKKYCREVGFSYDVIPALNFLNVIRIRQKLIVDGKSNMLPRWKERENIILKQIY
ncbi:MAG: methyltransferase domain-containing protein [Candidatus Omnitrophica bacterium]|nr:methyltransferase domain-containing protein [Candidatus Omnitrophota bacterium]